jgi:hypothetical protein
VAPRTAGPLQAGRAPLAARRDTRGRAGGRRGELHGGPFVHRMRLENVCRKSPAALRSHYYQWMPIDGSVLLIALLDLHAFMTGSV